MKNPEGSPSLGLTFNFNSCIQLFKLLFYNKQSETFSGRMGMKAFIKFKEISLVLSKINSQSIIRNFKDDIFVFQPRGNPNYRFSCGRTILNGIADQVKQNTRDVCFYGNKF